MTELYEIQRKLETGELSVVQVVEYYLKNIGQQKHLNAFIEVFADEAINRAKKIDQKKNKGKLAGLVIAIKDTICYENHKVSAASKMLENYESPYSATAVERLIKEDAIIIGRTNCDEFAMGSSGEKSAFGKTLNPIDNSRVPGGSSSGSAAAVAANCCLAALGSDTGGSVRQPASFCGLVGLKPTYGLVSRWGLIAYASSFDQIGILTKNINDNAKIIEVIAGPDEKDMTLNPEICPDYHDFSIDTTKIKVAVFKESLDYPELNAEIKNRVLQFIQSLKKIPIQIHEISFPLLQYIVPAFHVLAPAEAMSNLARYDGLKYGYRAKNKDTYDELLTKSRSEGFGKEVKLRILAGSYVLREKNGYHYKKALKVRQMIKQESDKIFKEYDFIITPTTPDIAFKFGERSDNPEKMFLEDIYLMHANLTGNPAISLPLGKHRLNLPFGIQVTARKFDEKKLFAFSNYIMNKIE